MIHRYRAVASLAALNDCQISKRKGLEVYNDIPRAVEDCTNFVGDVMDSTGLNRASGRL